MIPAPSVFLIGATGSGKTSAIRTACKAGLETFVVFTEPAQSMLADIPCPHLHWRYVPPMPSGFKEILNRAHMQIDLQWSQIQRDVSDANKPAYAQVWYQLLYSFYDFKCDRCGHTFGDVTTWGPERALIVDGLSGVNTIALQAVCGAATTRDKGQWGAAMESELAVFGRKLVYDTRCLYVLIGHTRLLMSEETNTMLRVAHTIGSANASDWPRAFSDVIAAKRFSNPPEWWPPQYKSADGKVGWAWDTATTDTDVKSRNLPIEPFVFPDFGPLMTNWQAKSKT